MQQEYPNYSNFSETEKFLKTNQSVFEADFETGEREALSMQWEVQIRKSNIVSQHKIKSYNEIFRPYSVLVTQIRHSPRSLDPFAVNN